MFSTYSTIIGFFSLFSLVSTTGHLRLELTSSHFLAVHIKTNISAQTIFLNMGIARITSFHPKAHQESLEVTFSKRNGTSESHVYNLNTAGGKAQQTIVFSDIVLMVQSVFECDAGFIGDTCQETSTTSTTAAPTTTIATTTTTISRKTSIPETSSTASPSIRTISTNTTIFVIVSVILLMLIFIICFVLRTRQQNIQQDDAPSKKYQDDSGIDSPNCSRYTVAPYAEV